MEATGTGGGLKLFCEGVGEAAPDIVGASRKIKDGEIETCGKNGVAKITEISIGHDGIVIANDKGGPDFNVTRAQLFLALAKTVPQNGALVPNPYRTWNEIDPSLPAEKIEVLSPPTSGTRDAFVELVMDKGCETLPEIASLSGDAKKAACQQVREDGAYIDAGENDNLIVQKLQANPAAFSGIFGYSFLEQNVDTLKGRMVDGVAPSYEAISGTSYSVARDLFVYVKDAHRRIVPGDRRFVRELVSERAMGSPGLSGGQGPGAVHGGRARGDRSPGLWRRLAWAQRARSRRRGGFAALSGLARSTGTTVSAVLIAVLGLCLVGYFMGRSRAVAWRATTPVPCIRGRTITDTSLRSGRWGRRWRCWRFTAVGGDWLADRLALNNTPAAISALPPFEQMVQIDSARALASGGGLASPDRTLGADPRAGAPDVDRASAR